MEIKDVQLIHQEPVAAGEEIGANGETMFVPAIPESFTFELTHEDGSKITVPSSSDNRHYWEVKEWYDAQETKPFDFTFEEMPEPNFAETIYPEPEETEAPEEQTEPTVDEPKTLLPK